MSSTVPIVSVPGTSPAALAGTANTAAEAATIAEAEIIAIVFLNVVFILISPFKYKIYFI